jgi:predicted protein tyrosine phosphatase
MTTTEHKPGFRSVPLGKGTPGKLFLHSMPGRYEPWNDALAELAGHAVTHVISLAPEREIAEKSVLYARAVAAGTFPVARTVFAMRDYDVPMARESFFALAETTAARLRGGEHVLVHCAAGQGRTGMFAMCVLIALGYGHAAAVRSVHRAGSHPENKAQKKIVAEMARRQGRLRRLWKTVFQRKGKRRSHDE